MPCFKGLAVSIHTPDGPLAEHSIQKHSRAGRITSYIAVPPPKVPRGSTTGKVEQSAFAVSITLLVPGQDVPYSAPRPTPENPYPQARKVGPSPGGVSQSDGANYTPLTVPYIPRTNSESETLAAYIYFDGRPKEEVATLLRRGEETWVNSRWVSLPGGGLAERDFLFREVGLERFLNGLDLGLNPAKNADPDGRRKKKLARRKERAKARADSSDEEGEERDRDGVKANIPRDEVLRYGGDSLTPVDAMSQDGGINDASTSSSSDDDESEQQAAGQIKVALFRVLASGDVKKGEYEAQFDAQDEVPGDEAGGDDLDHTTSLADPKVLDPKTISTQTVTGLDGPDHPYAVFTFLYRGEKQLRKMGIIESPGPREGTGDRKATDFGNLDPLTKYGTVGFSGYREGKRSGREPDDMMDSDPDDDDSRLPQDKDDEVVNSSKKLSAEEMAKQRELAEGVRQIKLKRAHSSEAMSNTRKSPRMEQLENTPPIGRAPPIEDSTIIGAAVKPNLASTTSDGVADGTSPFKKQKAADGVDTTGAASDGVGVSDSSMDLASAVAPKGSGAPEASPNGREGDVVNVDDEL